MAYDASVRSASRDPKDPPRAASRPATATAACTGCCWCRSSACCSRGSTTRTARSSSGSRSSTGTRWPWVPVSVVCTVPRLPRDDDAGGAMPLIHATSSGSSSSSSSSCSRSSPCSASSPRAGARPRSLEHLDEWGLGGRNFGAWITLVPARRRPLHGVHVRRRARRSCSAVGALGFFAVPYTILIFPMAFIVAPRLWSVAHKPRLRHAGRLRPRAPRLARRSR